MKYDVCLRTFLGNIFNIIFPLRSGVDFIEVSPENIFETLPRSKNLSGATALIDKRKTLAVLAYKDRTTRALVWNIKFKRNRHAIACAGYILYRTLMEIITEKNSAASSCIIIPMPISAARRRERGYNQCELMAEAVLRCDIRGIFEMRTDILIKIKNVKKQTFKNRQERLVNAEKIFKVTTPQTPLSPQNNLTGDIKKRMIFLLDDVVTTGSTMQAAMDCLHQAGFENVHGISLAH
jgi:ComF family protein